MDVMKILVIGNFGVSWDGSICDEEHVATALESLGHEVARGQRESIVVTKELDLVIISQWSGYPEHVCQKLKEANGCPVVYWAFDYQFGSHETWHFEMAKEADYFLSSEMEHREFYKDLGANFVWFPQSFAPDFLEPVAGVQEEFDVVFTGSLNRENKRRLDVLKAVDEKFDLHIFTTTPGEFHDFKNVHPAVVDHGLPELIAKGRIHLSVDSYHVMGSWSDRNAQIMACGGFCLFKYVPMAENFFQDGVAYFHTTKECLEKIEYFLTHELERCVIATKGIIMSEQFKATGRVQMMLEAVKENS
jgi:hypothetical protein